MTAEPRNSLSSGTLRVDHRRQAFTENHTVSMPLSRAGRRSGAPMCDWETDSVQLSHQGLLSGQKEEGVPRSRREKWPSSG